MKLTPFDDPNSYRNHWQAPDVAARIREIAGCYGALIKRWDILNEPVASNQRRLR